MQGPRRNLVPILVGIAAVLVSLASIVVIVDHAPWWGWHAGARYSHGSMYDGHGGGFDMHDRSDRSFRGMPGAPGGGAPQAPQPRGVQPGGTGVILGIAGQAAQGGVSVQDVQVDSPAQHAGVRVGDLIIRADGKETPSVTALRTVVQAMKPGAQYDLVVRRDGAEQTLHVEAQVAPTPAPTPGTAS